MFGFHVKNIHFSARPWRKGCRPIASDEKYFGRTIQIIHGDFLFCAQADRLKNHQHTSKFQDFRPVHIRYSIVGKEHGQNGQQKNCAIIAVVQLIARVLMIVIMWQPFSEYEKYIEYEPEFASDSIVCDQMAIAYYSNEFSFIREQTGILFPSVSLSLPLLASPCPVSFDVVFAS